MPGVTVEQIDKLTAELAAYVPVAHRPTGEWATVPAPRRPFPVDDRDDVGEARP